MDAEAAGHGASLDQLHVAPQADPHLTPRGRSRNRSRRSGHRARRGRGRRDNGPPARYRDAARPAWRRRKARGSRPRSCRHGRRRRYGRRGSSVSIRTTRPPTTIIASPSRQRGRVPIVAIALLGGIRVLDRAHPPQLRDRHADPRGRRCRAASPARPGPARASAIRLNDHDPPPFAALGAVEQLVVGQDQRDHRLDHRRAAQPDAGIVAARHAERRHRRGRLEGGAQHDRLAGRDAAGDAAGKRRIGIVLAAQRAPRRSRRRSRRP